ncbi:hypothetical protein [Nocardia stercoris]|uniref:Uncharacterized protein n=1 Tax=Nocardia stercoris TaxID=2483361 RepID=A0A3M2L9V2_9NOCA|nr:hypothetical protein [Nocardia stercoris]RMI33480.1 hypothetical protein EBN03_10135 [Nocardia stercoris]
MNQSRTMSIGAVAAGMLLSAAAAGVAGADDPAMTVDAAIPCAGNTYTITVPAIKVPAGSNSYHFLDGATLSTATQIDADQPTVRGADFTSAWTPAAAGDHKLWLALSGGTGGFLGPVVFTVLDAGDPTCTPSTTVPVTSTPVPTTTSVPTGPSDLGTWLTALLSSLSASA